MKATDELRAEHEGIGVMLRVLEAVAEKLGEGEAVDPGDLDGMLEFLTVFVDRCHHGKEELHLFPALEKAGVPRENGPIGVMLGEHEEGRRLILRLREALDGLEPADAAGAESARRVMEEYVTLLDGHIAKENRVLFAMADARLDPGTDGELVAAFARLEQERIGEGRHEAFHALLGRLEAEYLF